MKFLRIDENHELFEKCDKLYESAFPIFERRFKKDQIRALSDDNFYYTAITDDEIFVGIIFYWKTEEYSYIEHFAIDDSLRGKNYGTRALTKFCELNSDKPVILEIEPVVDEPTAARLRFYSKLGFVQADVEHWQLEFHEECPKMRLEILAKPEITPEFYLKFKTYLNEDIAKFNQIK